MKKIIVGTFLATLVSTFAHKYLGHLVSSYVFATQKGSTSLLPPFSINTGNTDTIFFLTAIFRILVLALLFNWLFKKIPGKTFFAKGTFFGIVVLFLNNQIFVKPISSFLVGYPLDLIMIQNSELIVSEMLTSWAIAAVIGWQRNGTQEV